LHTILLALLLTIASPKADEQFRLGKQLVDQSDPAKAVTALQDALRLGYGDKLTVHRLLLSAYAALGDQASAKREMEAILALAPDDREVRLMWIDTLPPPRRLEELRVFAEKSPDIAVLHYLLARVADVDEATKSARRWLDLAPVQEQRDLMADLFSSRSEADLRRILKSDAKLYPASFTLALMLIDKPESDAYEQLRAFYRDAPALVATASSPVIFRKLRAAGRVSEGQRLLQEFGTKLEEGAQQQR
jgi:hypothetical protein